MASKVEQHVNNIPDPQTREAVRRVVRELVADIADHKAKYDAHTHDGAAGAPAAGEQFKEPGLK